MMNFNIYQYEPHWYHLGFCYSYHPSTSFVGTELFVVSILILLLDWQTWRFTKVYQSNRWFTSHFRHLWVNLWVNGFLNGKVCFIENTITWNWNVKSGMARTRYGTNHWDSQGKASASTVKDLYSDGNCWLTSRKGRMNAVLITSWIILLTNAQV